MERGLLVWDGDEGMELRGWRRGDGDARRRLCPGWCRWRWKGSSRTGAYGGGGVGWQLSLKEKAFQSVGSQVLIPTWAEKDETCGAIISFNPLL